MSEPRAGPGRRAGAGSATDPDLRRIAGTNQALLFLLRLRFRGALRRLQQTVSTTKGQAMVAVGVFFVLAWFGSLLLGGQRSGPPDLEAARGWIPAMLLFMLGTGVLRISSDRAVSYSPAEVAFLFSAPFSRRQVLLYKVGILALVTLISSIPMAVVGLPYLGSAFRTLPGIFAAFLLVQLVGMLVALLRERLGQVLTGRLGWGIGGLVLLLAGSGIIAAIGTLDLGDPQAIFEAIRSSPGWRAIEIVLAPFTIAITAATVGELALALSGAAVINVAVLGGILLLDANYLEAAARISERTYAARERAQSQGLAWAKPARGHRRVPRLPHWGGAGTVAWRQLTAVRRGSFGIVLAFLGGAVVLGGWLPVGGADPFVLILTAAMLFPFVILAAESLRFDFRGDFEALEMLKAMPLRPIPMALGQIAVPTLLLATVVLAIVGPSVVVAGYGGLVPLLAILFLMVNMLMFSVKNYLFLHFPVQARERNPADIRFIGRMILFLAIEGVVLALAVGPSAVAGIVASTMILAGSAALGVTLPPIGIAAAGTVVFLVILGGPVFVLLWMTGQAYEKLDPSRLLAG